MIRRTPRATRTDTRFADTTLFRSTEGPGSGRPICGCVGRTAASGGFSSCRFPLAAFEGPDQQPRPADRHDERAPGCDAQQRIRSEEHTSELQSLMRISYSFFCLKNKTTLTTHTQTTQEQNVL